MNYDVLYEYALRSRLDFNVLCCVVRAAAGVEASTDAEAAYQRGKRAGYSEGYRAGRDGVAPCDGGQCGVGGYCDECPAGAPDGAEVLHRILRCRYPVHKSIHPSGYGWDTSRLNEVIADLADEKEQPPLECPKYGGDCTYPDCDHFLD